MMKIIRIISVLFFCSFTSLSKVMKMDKNERKWCECLDSRHRQESIQQFTYYYQNVGLVNLLAFLFLHATTTILFNK